MTLLHGPLVSLIELHVPRYMGAVPPRLVALLRDFTDKSDCTGRGRLRRWDIKSLGHEVEKNKIGKGKA